MIIRETFYPGQSPFSLAPILSSGALPAIPIPHSNFELIEKNVLPVLGRLVLIPLLSSGAATFGTAIGLSMRTPMAPILFGACAVFTGAAFAEFCVEHYLEKTPLRWGSILGTGLVCAISMGSASLVGAAETSSIGMAQEALLLRSARWIHQSGNGMGALLHQAKVNLFLGEVFRVSDVVLEDASIDTLYSSAAWTARGLDIFLGGAFHIGGRWVGERLGNKASPALKGSEDIRYVFKYGNQRVSVVGGSGELGSAFLHKIVPHALPSRESLYVTGRRGKFDNITSIVDKVKTTTDHALAMQQSDLIFLVVPPAEFNKMSFPQLRPDQVVVSFMSGVSHEQIAQKIPNAHIVRGMSTVGFTPIAWMAKENLPKAAEESLSRFFGGLGVAARVDSDAHIDAFTAIFGTGNGTIALLQEIIVEGVVERGFSRDLARKWVSAMFQDGSQRFMQAGSAGDYVRYMDQYSGLTTALMNSLRSAGLQKIFKDAFQAALDRGEELARH